MNNIITIVAIHGKCNFLDDILFSDSSVFENKVECTFGEMGKITRQSYRV